MKFDVAIIGSGLAGLSVALHLAATRRVVVISKGELKDGASNWAQGGIAAVLDSGDSHQQHIDDTLAAGGGLCDEAATRFIVEHGRPAIDWLIEQGVPFTRDLGAELGFHLTREGGHSQRRIIHAADATGQAVQLTLEQRVRHHPNITLLEHHCVVDLIRQRSALGWSCSGLYVQQRQEQVKAIAAHRTVLATGGAGQVYLHTSNPESATGDGIAMAWRAGCRVANMEFIQFHPTCLYHPQARSVLISEALRGEGALLRLPGAAGALAGQRFMPEHHASAELAPRDTVARAIDWEMKKHGVAHVDLDISHQPAAFIAQHFPTIMARCAGLGIDITRGPIPVVPAAHYTCGGVVTDLAGRTDLPHLYAVGETAYTGLHGANRLASNSLLECLVLGRAAAFDIERALATGPVQVADVPHWAPAQARAGEGDPDATVAIALNRDELRRSMWDYVGIVRSDARLQRAQRRIALLREELDLFYARLPVSRALLELRNLVDVASLIVSSAQLRRESRGLHFSLDQPGQLPRAMPTILCRPQS